MKNDKISWGRQLEVDAGRRRKSANVIISIWLGMMKYPAQHGINLTDTSGKRQSESLAKTRCDPFSVVRPEPFLGGGT